jgi:hypothetical protein
MKHQKASIAFFCKKIPPMTRLNQTEPEIFYFCRFETFLLQENVTLRFIRHKFIYLCRRNVFIVCSAFHHLTGIYVSIRKMYDKNCTVYANKYFCLFVCLFFRDYVFLYFVLWLLLFLYWVNKEI